MAQSLLRAACCVLALFATAPAWAQAGVKTTQTTPTLSTSSGNCLAVNQFRKSLTLDNTGGSIAIGYCEGVACTAAIGTAGTATLAAGALHFWSAGSAPSSQFCFIAASGTPGLTIKEGL